MATTQAAGLQEPAKASQEPLTTPIRLVGGQPRPSARLRLAALLVALAAHTAVVFVLSREPPDLMAGGQGLVLDAVNVTVVSSTVFESRQDVRASPTPATADAVEAIEGKVEGKPRPQRPEHKEEKAEATKAPDELIPVEARVRAPPRVPEPAKDQEKERKEASTAADAVGGVTARGDASSSAKQSGPAAASPGAVREYASYVVQALARTKPKGSRQYRTVKVRLGLRVSVGGDIASLKILKSSGSKRLDDAALAAVQRAKLPPPPPGLSDEERWFEFNYSFRFD